MKITLYKNYRSITLHRWNSPDLSDGNDNIVGTFDNVNFEYNDSVNSKLILNVPTTDYKIFNSFETLTYLNVDNLSNWYILGSRLIRAGQYELILKRDLLCDYIKEIKSCDFDIYRSFYTFDNNLLSNEDFKTEILPYLFNNDDFEKNKSNDFLIKRYDLKAEEYQTYFFHPTYTTYDNPFFKTPISEGVFLTENGQKNTGFYYILVTKNFKDKVYLDYTSKLKDNVNTAVEIFSNSDYIEGREYSYFLFMNSHEFDIKTDKTLNEPQNAPFIYNVENSIAYDLIILPRYTRIKINHPIDQHGHSEVAVNKIIKIDNFIQGFYEKFSDFVIDVQLLPFAPKLDKYSTTERFIYLTERTEKDIKKNFLYMHAVAGTWGCCIPFWNLSKDIVQNDVTINFKLNEILNLQDKNLTEIELIKILQNKTTALLKSNNQQINYNIDLFKTFYNDYKNINLTNNQNLRFKITQEIKPFNSFIYINFSEFNNNLYNFYYYDHKALNFIDNSSYTIDLNKDVYQSYLLNNKNYQEIFNRQLRSQDVQFTLNQFQSAFNSASKAIGQFGSGNVAGAVATGATSLINQGFEIGSHFESRQAKIDIQNLQIDNIKSQANVPIIKNNFTNTYFDFPQLFIYKDFDTNINNYLEELREKGIIFNQKHVNLKDFISDKKLIYPTKQKAYLQMQFNINNNDNLNKFSNLIFNNINDELSKGVYLEEKTFNYLKED